VIKKTFKFLSKQNLTDPKPLNGSVLNKNYILTLQWQPERVHIEHSKLNLYLKLHKYVFRCPRYLQNNEDQDNKYYSKYISRVPSADSSDPIIQ